jgi:hypothetical protein
MFNVLINRILYLQANKSTNYFVGDTQYIISRKNTNFELLIRTNNYDICENYELKYLKNIIKNRPLFTYIDFYYSFDFTKTRYLDVFDFYFKERELLIEIISMSSFVTNSKNCIYLSEIYNILRPKLNILKNLQPISDSKRLRFLKDIKQSFKGGNENFYFKLSPFQFEIDSFVMSFYLGSSLCHLRTHVSDLTKYYNNFNNNLDFIIAVIHNLNLENKFIEKMKINRLKTCIRRY